MTKIYFDLCDEDLNLKVNLNEKSIKSQS